MTGTRLSWKTYFMVQALMISQRSTCDRAYVGAVLTKNDRILSTGYNGSISGDVHCLDEGHKLRDGHCIRTVHSEVNAITQCARYGIPTNDTSLYVTHFPCLNCTKTLIQSGVTSIYYLHDYNDDTYAKELLTKSGIHLENVNLSFDDLETTMMKLKGELND